MIGMLVTTVTVITVGFVLYGSPGAAIACAATGFGWAAVGRIVDVVGRQP